MRGIYSNTAMPECMFIHRHCLGLQAPSRCLITCEQSSDPVRNRARREGRGSGGGEGAANEKKKQTNKQNKNKKGKTTKEEEEEEYAPHEKVAIQSYLLSKTSNSSYCILNSQHNNLLLLFVFFHTA